MQLAEMGFPLEACRKAVYYTGNMGPEMAFNWIIAHMEEPGKDPRWTVKGTGPACSQPLELRSGTCVCARCACFVWKAEFVVSSSSPPQRAWECV